MGYTCHKQLLTGTGESHIQFPVNPYPTLFRKIGKEFQLISTVHTEGINNHIALTPLEALYGIYQDIV